MQHTSWCPLRPSPPPALRPTDDGAQGAPACGEDLRTSREARIGERRSTTVASDVPPHRGACGNAGTMPRDCLAYCAPDRDQDARMQAPHRLYGPRPYRTVPDPAPEPRCVGHDPSANARHRHPTIAHRRDARRSADAVARNARSAPRHDRNGSCPTVAANQLGRASGSRGGSAS